MNHSQNGQRPKQKTVKLSDGRSICVGQLSWKGFKAAKRRLAEFLEGDMPAILASIDQSNPSGSIAKVVTLAIGVLDDETPYFIRQCLDPVAAESLGDFESLYVGDVLELRAAVGEVNDMSKILDLEKNLAVSVVSKAMEMAETANVGATSLGMSHSNPSSADFSDGLYRAE